MGIPVFMDNEAKLKSPVSLKLNKMENGEVCFNSNSEVGAQPQDVQVQYNEVVVPSYNRVGKECSISELQEGDVAYTVEGVVATRRMDRSS